MNVNLLKSFRKNKVVSLLCVAVLSLGAIAESAMAWQLACPYEQAWTGDCPTLPANIQTCPWMQTGAPCTNSSGLEIYRGSFFCGGYPAPQIPVSTYCAIGMDANNQVITADCVQLFNCKVGVVAVHVLNENGQIISTTYQAGCVKDFANPLFAATQQPVTYTFQCYAEES